MDLFKKYKNRSGHSWANAEVLACIWNLSCQRQPLGSTPAPNGQGPERPCKAVHNWRRKPFGRDHAVSSDDLNMFPNAKKDTGLHR